MIAYSAFASFLEHLEDEATAEAGIVTWACPVPYFGQIRSARLATVGLNPSFREFATAAGDEIVGLPRRFPTLTSLGLGSWLEADATHVDVIALACNNYFAHNPYKRWFGALDRVLSFADTTYYGDSPTACHLDLVPFATYSRWGDLPTAHRRRLLTFAGRHLGAMISQAHVRAIILNGKSVVSHFSAISNTVLEAIVNDDWRLRSGADGSVPGVAYLGTATQIGGISLDTPLVILGFNHNLQSSFGVTTKAIDAIGRWISELVSP